MQGDKSGAGYGNHGGDETYDESKKTEAGDPTRIIPDDGGKGDYDDEDEQEPDS